MRELRVLIVEDDHDSAFLIEQAIGAVCGEEGCFCTVTRDPGGDDILGMHKQFKFDLIIVDLCLPNGRSGLSVIKSIRAEDKTVEFIIVTGYPTVETAIEAITQDVWAYFVKPFNLNDLLCQSRKAIEHSILKKKLLSLARLSERVFTNGD